MHLYVRLSVALTKATASRVPRVHGTSNTGALRIHWDELKNSTDRESDDGEWNSEALSQCSASKYICAKLILNLQLTHWLIQSENVLDIG